MNRAVGVSVVFTVLVVAANARAAAEPTVGAAPELPELAAATDRALVQLATRQRADGSIHDGQQPARVTALALTAFLSAGHPPADGRFGRAVSRAADYLVAKVPEDGYIGGPDGSGMTGQATVATALALSLGVEPDEDRRARLRAALVRCVAVIVRAQAAPKPERFVGGWGDDRTAADAELTVTVWSVIALRAAGGVGVPVPRDTLARATAFLLACRTPSGGLAPAPREEPTPGATGAGVVALYLLTPPDRPEPPELAPAVEYVLAHAPRADDKLPGFRAFSHLQAARLAGDAAFDRAAAQVFPMLLALQRNDGAFPASADPREPGPAYATAMAVLTFTVPTSPLPVFER